MYGKAAPRREIRGGGKSAALLDLVFLPCIKISMHMSGKTVY